MEFLPANNIVTTNGEYAPVSGRFPGRPVAVEVSGTFDGATVELGYASSDDTPVFVADSVDTDMFYAAPKTAPGRWFSSRASSGKPAIKVTNAGASTAILVTIVDLYSR